MEDANVQEIKKSLFKYSMKGEWTEVVKIYRQQPKAYKTEIVASGDTALHVAVSEGKESSVEELVGLIAETDHLDALEVRNEQGNTPLHLAATTGNVFICKCLADKHPKLVALRNRGNETPLFLAVRHGRKDAFLFLHQISDTAKRDEYGRGANGKTILHSAISGDFFDLAFQIIHLYENFVNFVDEEGFTPLHILAGKPSAFRSGTHLSWISNIIYQCLIVEKLEKREGYNRSFKTPDGKKKLQYPDNYRTCMSFWKIIKIPVSMGRRRQNDLIDFENPKERKYEGQQSRNGSGKYQLLPPNYDIILEFFKLANKAVLVVLGFGIKNVQKIREKKEKHTWSCQIMDELLKSASMYEYDSTGRKPLQASRYNKLDEEAMPHFHEQLPISDTNEIKNQKEYGNKEMISPSDDQTSCSGKKHMKNKKEKKKTAGKGDAPILIAARNGVKEIVEKILEIFPVAIHERDSERKNAVLLAVENRQPDVYEVLLRRSFMRDIVFSAVDNEGNSALHLAAMLRDSQPWHIPGHALQMQWEIKWYKYVKKTMPRHFFPHLNNHDMTPKEIFTENHTELVSRGGKWLNNTASSGSVVATLIASVAFASFSNVPGSFDSDGLPTLEHHRRFTIFALASLVALCSSVTSLIIFLAILTSRHQEKDFHKELPNKLAWGLTSLFMSIWAMLISFCAAHSLTLERRFTGTSVAIYVVACSPIALFAAGQLPLYLDVLRAGSRKVPQRSYKVDL